MDINKFQQRHHWLKERGYPPSGVMRDSKGEYIVDWEDSEPSESSYGSQKKIYLPENIQDLQYDKRKN